MRTWQFGLKVCRYSSSSCAGSSPSRIIVVGGGIVGLAVARHLCVHNQQDIQSVHVIEKEKNIAMHQSGNNSGVLHAGIYYAPKSERAILCTRGNQMMRKYCTDHGIPLHSVGKCVVPVTKLENSTWLPNLFERAQDNGCDVEWVTGEDARKTLQPTLNESIPRVLFSPNTANVDFKLVCNQMRKEIEDSPIGSIEYGKKITYRELLALSKDNPSWRIIVCGGLNADRLMDLNDSFKAMKHEFKARLHPIAGFYWEVIDAELRNQIDIRTNIYPVPNPSFPFLGVHATPHFPSSGGQPYPLFGPTAVPELFYSENKELTERLERFFHFATHRALYQLAFRYFDWTIQQWKNKYDASAIASIANSYFQIEAKKQQFRRYPNYGVRALLVRDSGELIEDFLFHKSQNGKILHVLNAPSPAATASLAIAERVCEAIS